MDKYINLGLAIFNTLLLIGMLIDYGVKENSFDKHGLLSKLVVLFEMAFTSALWVLTAYCYS